MADYAEIAQLIHDHRFNFFDERDLQNGIEVVLQRAKVAFEREASISPGEQVVLYGWHHAVYEIWRQQLTSCGIAFITGEESPNQKEAAKQAFIRKEAKVLIISLRAGAGIDGLQSVCRTVVFGELDWSPGVHTQCVGRIYRDGQPDPVMAYFLVSDSGSDPVMLDVLGLKKQQFEGVRDPHAALVEDLSAEQGRVARMAEAFLKQRGVKLPQEDDDVE